LIAENKNTAHAIPAYRQALQLKPNLHAATSLLAYELQKICDWTEWHTLREQVINAVRDDTAKGKINPFSFLSLTDDAALQQQCARQHAKQFFAPLAAKAPLKRLSVQQHHKLRIGYLSADFRQHPLSYLMAEVFELHDRSQFELFGYSIGPNDQSATRARVQAAFDHFIEAKPLSIQETAQRIAEDEIDILVDLTGYTTHSRSQLMALRPAAVQVQFLGNGCTLGTHYVDYLIVDDIIIPESQFNFYDEKIVWLPNSYQPNDRKRPVATIPSRQEAGLPEQGFVFCCFNASYKITPDFFSIWMRLLNAVPQSVLWLLESNAAMSSNLQREAQLRGVDPQRILFAPKKPLAEHLARLSLADLVLDTQYYGAHTTMSDALWVGVPAITYLGNSFTSRIGGGLLRAAKLPELVTHSVQAYEALAVELALHPAKLAAFKQRLQASRDTCALFDTPRYVRHLEQAYRLMWQRYAQGLAPAPLQVVDTPLLA